MTYLLIIVLQFSVYGGNTIVLEQPNAEVCQTKAKELQKVYERDLKLYKSSYNCVKK